MHRPCECINACVPFSRDITIVSFASVARLCGTARSSRVTSGAKRGVRTGGLAHSPLRAQKCPGRRCRRETAARRQYARQCAGPTARQGSGCRAMRDHA
eukprot:scaffold189208_cov33-Tisochrysis_lutea.AAC.3